MEYRRGRSSHDSNPPAIPLQKALGHPVFQYPLTQSDDGTSHEILRRLICHEIRGSTFGMGNGEITAFGPPRWSNHDVPDLYGICGEFVDRQVFWRIRLEPGQRGRWYIKGLHCMEYCWTGWLKWPSSLIHRMCGKAFSEFCRRIWKLTKTIKIIILI